MKFLQATVAVSALFALANCASAQPDADHAAHHTDNTLVAQAPAPTPPAGMMGQGNAGMMQQRGGMMSGANAMPMTGMMTGDRGDAGHVADRLATVKTKLNITPAQTKRWDAFAAAVDANTKAMVKMRTRMMARDASAQTLLQRLDAEEDATEAHYKAMKKTRETLKDLYRTLSDDQKKIADGIVIGPMGMPMGMM